MDTSLAASALAAENISIMPSTKARDVSFTSPISELLKGGKAVRRACGSTIRAMICR